MNRQYLYSSLLVLGIVILQVKSARADSFVSEFGVSTSSILPYQAVRHYIARQDASNSSTRSNALQGYPRDLSVLVKNRESNPEGYVHLNALLFLQEPIVVTGNGEQPSPVKTINSKQHYVISQSFNSVMPIFGSKDSENIYNLALFTLPGEYKLSVTYTDELHFVKISHQATLVVREPKDDDLGVYQYLRAEPYLLRMILAPTEDVRTETRELCLKLLAKYPRSEYANDLHLGVARSYLHGTGYRPFKADWQDQWLAKFLAEYKKAAAVNRPTRPKVMHEYDPGYMPSRTPEVAALLDQAYEAIRNQDVPKARELLKSYSAWRWPTTEARKLAQEHLLSIKDRKYAFYSLAKMMQAFNERELTGKTSPELLELMLQDCVADQEFNMSRHLLGYEPEKIKDIVPLTTTFYEKYKQELFAPNAKQE